MARFQSVYSIFQSYKHFPCDLEVIDWIQSHYMSLGVPEKALAFVKKAAIVAPTDIKWQLLVAACHKRTGNHMKALQVYKTLHRENPENIECKYLDMQVTLFRGHR